MRSGMKFKLDLLKTGTGQVSLDYKKIGTAGKLRLKQTDTSLPFVAFLYIDTL